MNGTLYVCNNFMMPECTMYIRTYVWESWLCWLYMQQTDIIIQQYVLHTFDQLPILSGISGTGPVPCVHQGQG